jgi:uncharacterized membrane protein YfcA
MGGYLGGKLAIGLPEDILKKTFAVVMVVIGFKLLFFSGK